MRRAPPVQPESTRIRYSCQIIKHVNCVTWLHFRHLFEFRVTVCREVHLPWPRSVLPPHNLPLVCRVWARLDCSSKGWVSLRRKLSEDETRYFTVEEAVGGRGCFCERCGLLFVLHNIRRCTDAP